MERRRRQSAMTGEARGRQPHPKAVSSTSRRPCSRVSVHRVSSVSRSAGTYPRTAEDVIVLSPRGFTTTRLTRSGGAAWAANPRRSVLLRAAHVAAGAGSLRLHRLRLTHTQLLPCAYLLRLMLYLCSCLPLALRFLPSSTTYRPAHHANSLADHQQELPCACATPT